MADGAQLINFSSEQETTLARRNLLLQMRVLVHGVVGRKANMMTGGDPPMEIILHPSMQCVLFSLLYIN
ncbi:unnamed protein product [Clavelina lepadiformis]|uniref:Uncharacterized protein n=1 Tax=Clavelina lepadiformis TaxID=159417 RepID=A0ABP0GJK2_CLALP